MRNPMCWLLGHRPDWSRCSLPADWQPHWLDPGFEGFPPCTRCGIERLTIPAATWWALPVWKRWWP